MWKYLDRTLAALLALGAAVGHTLGSLAAYAHEPATLLWSLNTSVFGATLGALHLLRSFRPADRALAALLLFPTLAWLVSALCFGRIIGAPADPRVVFFALTCVGLSAFSLRALLPRPPAALASISRGSAARPSPRS
jgi:hypothetical protein